MTVASTSRSGLLDRATLGLAALAGVFLMLVLSLVFLGVITRYVFNAPIVGINEFVQLASVGVVMLALPYCTAQGGHVTVDVLDQAIGPMGRRIGDLQSRALSIFVLAVLVWRAGLKAADAHRYGDATNMLGLALWPFYAFLAIGMALCILVYLSQIPRILAGKEVA